MALLYSKAVDGSCLRTASRVAHTFAYAPRLHRGAPTAHAVYDYQPKNNTYVWVGYSLTILTSIELSLRSMMFAIEAADLRKWRQKTKTKLVRKSQYVLILGYT